MKGDEKGVDLGGRSEGVKGGEESAAGREE